MSDGPTWVDYVSSIGTLFASLAALAAVAITLYLNIWRERRRAPNLTLRIPHEASNGAGYDLQADGGPIVMAPLLVENETGKRSARDVELLISAGYWLKMRKDERGRPAPRFYERINLDPLTWWVSEPHQGLGESRADIPPGIARKAAVLLFGHPATLFGSLDPRMAWADLEAGAQDAFRQMLGIFMIVPVSQETRNWIDNQLAYEIRLTVVAEDMDPVSYRTRLRWSGVTHQELSAEASDSILVRPIWDELEPIEPEAWPGPVPADTHGWVED